MNDYCIIPADALRTMLDGAMVAVGIDRTLPTLTGIRIEWSQGVVTVVSTDRYRLYRGIYDTSNHGEAGTFDDGAILLPASEVKAILSLLPKVNPRIASNVMVALHGSGYVAGGNGSWNRTCQLMSGEFPKWRTLIEREPDSVENIGFNPKYLADIAKIPHDKGQRMVMRFTGSTSPTFMYYEGRKVADVDAMYMLMPCRSVV